MSGVAGSGLALGSFEKRTSDCLSDELGALPPPARRDGLELCGDPIVELDQNLFHMIQHIMLQAEQ